MSIHQSPIYTQRINTLSLPTGSISNMFVHVISPITQTLTVIFLSIPFLISSYQLDYSTLIFKQCDSLDTNSLQKITTTTYASYSNQNLFLRAQAISSLLRKLESESSRSKFFKTLVGSQEHAVSGWFQCRSDYPIEICHKCVSDLREISSRLCGNATSARVYLRGCHLMYETELVDTHNARKYIYCIIG